MLVPMTTPRGVSTATLPVVVVAVEVASDVIALVKDDSNRCA